VAVGTAALGLLALASLSPTAEPPRGTRVQAGQLPASVGSVHIVRESFALAR
jgi:hypothetical protein